jgi:hypothetical protein
VTCKGLVGIGSDKEKLENTENINNIKIRAHPKYEVMFDSVFA